MPDSDLKHSNNLLILVGQEGSGKSTTVRALLKETPSSAQIDAEDVGQVNPWQMDAPFLQLMWKNVAGLTRNFWEAGYHTVLAGSFLSNVGHYQRFREILPDEASIYIVQLCAGKPTRDVRRAERPKQSTKEWWDMVDRVDPEDTTFATAQSDFRFLRIDNDGRSVSDTIDAVRAWAPELYRDDVGR
jgi:GTPase SAR1 family protein